MGTCIICGADTAGHICDTHEEDVVFEFRGDRPEQLVPGRFYRGEVDGFADFGVFVDVGEGVTGLLHRSEIPGRLESLDWEPGDKVFVQVDEIHDNGNVDLSWSIRQSDREFRGTLVHDPEAESTAELPEEETVEEAVEEAVEREEKVEEEAEATEPETEEAEEVVEETEAEPEAETETEEVEEVEETETETEEVEEVEETETETEEVEEVEETETEEVEAEESEEPLEVSVDELEDHVGDRVVIEGEVTGARQTSGPTVFEITDETGAADCAAFEEAGVRAYPEVEVDDVVRLLGEVERRRGELQVETEDLAVLHGEDREAVLARLSDALDQRAHPTETALLVHDEEIEPVHEDVVAAATAIRRAVIESRPIVVRHTADVDGYIAGSAIERAVLPLVREEHTASDAEYHFFDRRPLDASFYDVDEATNDVTDMLEAADRHDEKHPLFVLVGTGSTRESVDGIEFLDLYDAPTVAIDGGYADGEAADAADVLVSPTQAGGDPVATGTLGTHVGALVNDDVRGDLEHLPAICYWEEIPETYADLAADAGVETDVLADIRDAIALEAFYQSYEDKRELIADLLWEENVDLASHVGDQFREKIETELDTAEPHLEPRNEAGTAFEVLNVDNFTHRYDFPPVALLLDGLFRRRKDEIDVLVGADSDEIRVRSTDHVDVRAVGERVAEELPESGVTPLGAEDGRIEFLAGERDEVIDHVVTAIADQLAE
ncbi:DHH family phosphoesterase [Halospeciosus flavus]|uniref:DHH family phosphoesterase n=1 Tax=Halospeciosus flavus TaxID=3032283 RepID=A0ABD5Z9Q3_9EURY|nr:OB-fold nucleic acid binding domain-containing protein [Halospeciosus flavus]